jgi:hypothetical protein
VTDISIVISATDTPKKRNLDVSIGSLGISIGITLANPISIPSDFFKVKRSLSKKYANINDINGLKLYIKAVLATLK